MSNKDKLVDSDRVFTSGFDYQIFYPFVVFISNQASVYHVVYQSLSWKGFFNCSLTVTLSAIWSTMIVTIFSVEIVERVVQGQKEHITSRLALILRVRGFSTKPAFEPQEFVSRKKGSFTTLLLASNWERKQKPPPPPTPKIKNIYVILRSKPSSFFF